MNLLKSNHGFFLFLLLVLASVLFFLDILLGSVQIPLKSIFNILTHTKIEKESWEMIILNNRLPKAIGAIVCGSALSVSGLQMQTLFRNPLAGPYILGISSGAGLGVAIFIMGISVFGFSFSAYSLLFNYGLLICSFVGSFLVLMILLSAIYRLKDIMTVLILGVMLGSIFTSVISVIQYFSFENQLKSFIVWTMGSLNNVTSQQLYFVLPIIFATLIWSIVISKQFNLYLLGEDYARTLGLNVRNFQLQTVIITAILSGIVTAYFGPIGFIGIVVPHIARLISKTSNHFILVPYSILVGTNILLFADILTSLPNSETVLPINAITSFIGIPIIIWILFRKAKITNVG